MFLRLVERSRARRVCLVVPTPIMFHVHFFGTTMHMSAPRRKSAATVVSTDAKIEKSALKTSKVKERAKVTIAAPNSGDGAFSPVEAAPRAGKCGPGRRPKSQSGEAFAEELQRSATGEGRSSPKLEINILRVIDEWNAVCAAASLEDSETGGEVPQSENRCAPTPTQASIAIRGAGVMKVAAIGACITRAFREPKNYPALHPLLNSNAQKTLSRERVFVTHTSTAIRDADQLQAAVTFLRLYRTSAFYNIIVYQRILEEILQSLVAWLRETASAGGKSRSTATLKRAVFCISLELYQYSFESNALPKPLNIGTERQKVSARKVFHDNRKKWMEDVTGRLIDEVFVAIASGIMASSNRSEVRPFTDVAADIAVVSLAIAIANAAHFPLSCNKKSWEECVPQMQASMTKRLSNITEEKLGKMSVSDIRTVAFDILSTLCVLNEATTVLSPPAREDVKHHTTNCFRRLCMSAGVRPAVFTDILCTSEMAQAVQSLPSADLCETIRSAIVTSATLFCQRADDASVVELLKHAISNDVKPSSVATGVSPPQDRVDECKTGTSGIKYIEPQSKRSKVAFGLFAAGYDPDAILGSGLCVGHSASEIVEVLYAAALFSRAFALKPLPTRISTILTSESASAIESRIRMDAFDNVQELDVFRKAEPLRDVLQRAKDKEENDSLNDLWSQRQKGATFTGRRGPPVPLATALHLAFSTSVELLMRGEEKKLSAHLVQLLTLLEREGSFSYLVDGLIVLIDTFVERFRTAGCLQTAQRQDARRCASHDVETALSEVTSLFVPRVVEYTARQLIQAKRITDMDGAEEQAARYMLRGLHDLTVYVASCGMNATVAKQIVGLHSTVLKSLLGNSEQSAKLSLAETVDRMNELVTHVRTKQCELAETLPPDSPWQRYCNIVVNDIVAVHIKPVAAAIRCGSCDITVTQERFHLLSLVRLLFRLVSEFAVEAEPAELQAFRNDVLDPALARFLLSRDNQAIQDENSLDLEVLSEITVVMCATRTIHHLSPQFFDQLTSTVKLMATQEQHLTANTKERRHLSKIVARLLTSAAAVCQLRRLKLTDRYLEIVAALTPLLHCSDVPAVLRSFVDYHVPTDNEAVALLRNLLAEEAGSFVSSLSLQEAMTSLQILCELEDVGNSAYVAMLRCIMESGHELKPGEIGIVVRIATKLQKSCDTLSQEDLDFLVDLPTQLVETVIQARQQCPPPDLPLVLKGFSRLDEKRYGELRQRVMKAYILRTIHVRQLFSAEEVVDCIESYTTAQISHQYLFGVLLSRVADVKLKFSLPLSVRLVMCGVNAAWDKGVQTACLTAAQPIFLGIVRHILQSDPASLPFVASNAVLVLHCLMEAFPNDPTCDLVLQNLADHHTALSTTTMVAILQLIAKKNSTEYNILRCMTDHAAAVLFPEASCEAFAQLTQLFIQCGVRSKVLFDALGARFKEIVDDCSSKVIVTLAEAFTVAHVDLENGVVSLMIKRTVDLVEVPGSSFEAYQYVTLLKFFLLVKAPDATDAIVLLLRNAEFVVSEMGDQVHPDFMQLTPTDISVILSAILSTHSSKCPTLVEKCADILAQYDEANRGGEGPEQIAANSWKADLLLVVQLAQHAVKLGLKDHPIVPLLLTILYDRRSALLRRGLLLQTTTEVVRVAGEKAHEPLYALLVKGELIA